MRIASIPSKRRRDLIIIAILLIGLPILVYASYQAYQLIVKASVEVQPKNVALSNLTTSSVTITWMTDEASNGSVIPIAGGQEKSPVLDKRGSGKRKTHYIEIIGLEPNMQYEFVIVSNSTKYSSEEGKSFKFKTAPITAETPTPNPIYGSISGFSGDDIIIFAMLKDKSTYPVSAVIPKGGNWIVDMSAMRDVTDFSLVPTSSSTNIVVLAITEVGQGGVIEGTYSELFDSNGKLKDVYPLSIGENSDLYSKFSPSSLLGQSISVITPPVVSTPLSEPLVEEKVEFERKYVLKQDLLWTDMLSSTGQVTGIAGAESIDIANVTDTGFTVVWLSSSKEEGYIKYGTSADLLTLEGQDEKDGIASRNSYFVHMVSVSRLLPETEYFFEVISGSETYDDDGKKYRITTYPTLSSPPPFDSASGDVEGLPEHKEAVILAHIEDKDGVGSQGKSPQIAASIDENGRWILSIADSRTTDGLSYFEYTSGDVLNLNVFTTFPTIMHQERMSDIGERDVKVILKEEMAVSYTKIDLLDNYGILGYSTGAFLQIDDTSNGDSMYDVDRGIETPKTGVFDSSLFLLLPLILLAAIVSLVSVYKMTKKSKKGNMKDSI